MSININVDSSWQTPLVGTKSTTNVSGITEPSNLRPCSNDSSAAPTPAIQQRSQAESAQPTTQTSQNQTIQDDEEQDDENHLLFSCQCDSAGSIGTLLACLRRVLSKSSNGTSPTVHTSTQATTTGGYGVATSKLQHTTVYAGPNGLTFHCVQGLAKQSQCSVDLPKGLFREYFVGEEEVWMESDDDSDDDEATATTKNNNRDGSQKKMRAKETIQGGEFAVNLTTVLECFSVLSKNHKPKIMTMNHNNGGNNKVGGEFASLNNVPLCMSYDRDSATFHLEFLDQGNSGAGGCLVTCEVPGVAVDEENGDQSSSGLASAFRSNPLIGRAILYSDALSAAVGELTDVPGASVVEVLLSKSGLELGAVGPRSEVWVTVPYHSRHGSAGMYVGLECYSDEGEEEDRVRKKYPLSAFLTGMRGLEIGCETCISVNSRGMMAIQHQVSRDDNGNGVRPSFVDFIMTCIEDEIDDEHDHDANDVRDDARHGMRDVTNDSSVQEEEASFTAKSVISKRSRRKQQPEESSQSSEEHHNDEASFHNDEDTEQAAEHDTTETNTRSTATSRILGELEVDNDMMSSNIGGANKRRMSALADIRRRRQRQSMNKRAQSDESEDQDETAAGSKRRSSANREESDDSEQSDQEQRRSSQRQKTIADTPQDPSQSESESSESEPGSLDVTADISQIYSKSASMRTSRHGSRRSADRSDADSEGEQEEEPRMMYGDTKLEFTQDGYGSDDSM